MNKLGSIRLFSSEAVMRDNRLAMRFGVGGLIRRKNARVGAADCPRRCLWAALALVATVLAAPAPIRAGLIIGQVDAFESGASTQGWTNGAAATDPVVTAGGPGGALDHFLKVAATGTGGAGSLLITYNRAAEWTGNYNTVGVTRIAMDLKNLDTNAAHTLSIRIAFKQTTAKTSPGYASTTAFTLPVDSQWHHAIFSLSNSSMTAIGSAPSLSSVLAAPGELRLLDSASPALDGDLIASTFGVDNITALGPVPEPSTLVLAGFGALGLVAIGWRRKRRAACGP